MKKLLSVIFVMVLSLTFGTQSFASTEPVKPVDVVSTATIDRDSELKKGTVVIESYTATKVVREDGVDSVSLVPLGTGSGVIMGNGYILTNEHVAPYYVNGDSYNVYYITFYNQYSKYSRVEATSYTRDPNQDLAILKYDDNYTPVEYKDIKPKFANKVAVDAPVTMIGNPFIDYATEYFHATEGTFGYRLDKDHNGNPKDIYFIDLYPGNSGGGVYDENNNLLGLVVGRNVSDDGYNLGYVIPTDIIKSFFNDTAKGLF